MKAALSPSSLPAPQLAALRALPLSLRVVHAFVRQALETKGLAVVTTDIDGKKWLTATRDGLLVRDAAAKAAT